MTAGLPKEKHKAIEPAFDNPCQGRFLYTEGVVDMAWNRTSKQKMMLNISEMGMLLVGLPLLIHLFDDLLRTSGLGLFVATILPLHYYIYKFYRNYKALILMGSSVVAGALITGLTNLPELITISTGTLNYRLFYFDYLVYTIQTGIVLYVLYSIYHCYRTHCFFNKKEK